MKHQSLNSDRRSFLKAAGLGSVTLFLPRMDLINAAETAYPIAGEADFSVVNFVADGLFYSPKEYMERLMQIYQDRPFDPDFYGRGGITQELEEAFAALTGKEKAVFLPTGTMANEVAIKLLAGDRTKIAVPENSHIFRDEADSAAAAHRKRLIPVGRGKPFFDVEDLERTISDYQKNEVFQSDVGAVSVENPVRRADGAAMPIETMQEISAYCRDKGYGLHLDGARLHLASAWTGVSLSEYAALFDTVYISQYKYLNAAFGAVLCGDADLIDQLPHQNKILGGMAFQTWTATAMAYHHLQTIGDELQQARKAGEQLIQKLNALDGIAISAVPYGTNVFDLLPGAEIDPQRLAHSLNEDHRILIRPSGPGEVMKIKINTSILRRPVDEIADAWEAAVSSASL